MEGYIHGDKGTRGSLGKVRKMLLGCLTPAFAVCLAVGLFLYFPISSGVQTYAADSSFNNIVNTNIGLHPKWEMSKPETYTEGGVGDNYTGNHNVWHVKVKDAANGDNDPILEQSPSYTFTGTEKDAKELSERYSLKKGNEVVFNVTEGMSPAKVWADAVAFAQSLGTPTDLADPSLLTCNSSGGWGAAEYHAGFRVGSNVNTRNKYQGNFFIQNEDGALGQYITVRLHTDWVAKSITASAPTSAGTTALNPAVLNNNYITVSGSTKDAIKSTSFNYISNKENETAKYLPASDSDDGFTRIDTNDNSYVIAYDLSSNSADYDSGNHGIFNENCAFSFGRINVPTGVYIVLDLNGHTIDRNLTDGSDLYGQVFHISSKARLEICDTSAYENASSLRIEGNTGNYKTNHAGTIKGGNAGGSSGLPAALQINLQNNGGGFNLSMWADLVIHSGTIENNKSASTGGAFYERSKSSVTIYDGYILENTAGTSGGVTSLGSGSGCSFCMYGGVLAYNKAGSNGGAVYLGPSSFGNFHGGEIVHNTATSDAGALYVNGNTLGILDSVTIKDNTATTHGGAVFVNHEVAAADKYLRTAAMGTAFKFRGSLQIYNNTAGSVTDNVYLEYDTTAKDWDVSGTGQAGKDLDELVSRATATTDFPKIGIGGSMFVNGIVARVGVTLSSTVPSTASTVFTSDYAEAHGAAGSNNGVNTYVYFFSDATGKSVINNGSGTEMEAQLGNHVAENGTLTWVIKGEGIYNSEKENITIEAKEAGSKLYTGTNGLERKGGISYTYEGLTCEFGMLKVTSVAAYTSYDEHNPENGRVAYWEITEPAGTGSYTITNSFTKAQFRFKLGEKDIEDKTSGQAHSLEFDSDMYKTINATDHSISYAGEYSFLVASDNTRYTNPNFKIKINQTGVVVDRQLYYNGQDVSKAPHNWTKDIDFDGNGKAEDDVARHVYEKNQPYFIYSGDYYYPVLSVDYNHTPNGMLSLYNPYTDKTTVVAKTSFTGYVLDFKYANTAYFGTGKDVDFGSHSGGGIEYQTMHRAPGSVSGIGTYVPGVMHAGMYTVSFISSRTAASADAANDDYKNTGVYFAANNFAFSSAVNLYVDPAGAEVQLTDKARDNFVYQGLAYTDREIVEFDNTSDTSVNPHTDDAASMVYYLFGSLKYKAGIYDERTGIYYTLDELATKEWESIRPYGKAEEELAKANPSRPYIPTLTPDELKEAPYVLYADKSTFKAGEQVGTYGGGLSDSKLSGFEALYQKERDPASTGRLCYIIDAESFTGEFYGQPIDARRYVVLVTLDLDVGYDDYDYEFDQDAEHLVGIDGKSDYFWAFEFTINPAEINPYEVIGPGGAPDGNTSVTLNKEHIFNNVEMKPNDARLGLSVSYGSTVLVQDTDGVGEGKDGAGDFTVELAPGMDYTNASVKSGEDIYNLPLIIRFGGSNKNYVNKDSTNAVKDTLDGSDAHEYGAEGDYAFVVYFRIIPVEVTVTGSLSYTYDDSSFERARFLAARDENGKHYDDWYESIFFLVQDGITTPSELITNQHADSYMTTGKFSAYDGGPEETRDLTDLWGRDNTLHNYDDATYHKNRFTLGSVSVNYSNEEFKQHEISFGIGLYAFKAESANQGNYHLSTVDADAFATGKTVVTTPRVTDEPEKEGATWIITYQPKDGKQVQAFNTSQNFVISSASFLDVTINQKDISELAGDITKVGITDFTHWKAGADKDNPGDGTLKADGKTEISYPFAGNNWKYEPGVTVQYQPFYYATSYEKQAGKTAYGNPLELKSGDYTISWMNNSSASTDENPARITLNGQGNYTGSLTLDFTITPAKIAVEYAAVGAVPQYDKTAHGVNVTYANVETDDAYSKYLNADPKILVGNGEGEFKKPQPDASVYSITYKARTRTADGFGAAASPAEITDGTVPIEAGVYDVKIVLGSDNYQFVNGTGDGSYFTPVMADGYSKTATGSHTILPAVVSYEYVNSGETYNRQAHTPQIKFTNITNATHATLTGYANIVPQAGEYTVTLAPKGGVYSASATDAGDYTVKVELLSTNYCFALELNTEEEFIHGYKVGDSTSTNGKTFNYDYTMRNGNDSAPYPTKGSWTAPAEFVIKKATIQLGQFDDSTYNRAAQPQTIVFSNTQSNNEAVPTLSGENAGKTIDSPEYTVTYTDNNIISSTDSLVGGAPYYSDLYSVKISLTEAGAKNFEFAARAITPPRFRHSEKAREELLRQNVLDGIAANSVITAPFLINRVNIDVTQLYSSDVYNAKDHFHATGTEGIAVENWVSAMFRYSSSSAIEADDLTVDVIFTKTTGDKASATVHYTPSGTDDTVNYNGKSYSFEDFAKEVGFFTHAATYDVTVQFNEESFYITNSGATDNNLKLGFTYTITPAQISFSLDPATVEYDTRSHKPTLGDGIVLTNPVNEKVLPTLVEGTATDVDRGAVQYSYSGWATDSDDYKNVGNYTVEITLKEGGDFQFADSSYKLSRDYTITALDISKEENFGAAVFTPDARAGHTDYKIPAYHYTSTEINPEITLTDVKDYSITLKTTDRVEEGKVLGMSVAYTDNVNTGSAKATLTGINNFTGTREETFWVLPAIVSITAHDGTNTETFNPNSAPQKEDGGSLTFSYNKTLQFLTYTFENLCGSAGTTPTSADYTVKYYKAEDWDKAANKPNGGAVPLEAEGITDSGDYYVWFEFKRGTKERSNFVFYKENGEATSVEDMFDSEGTPHLYKYGFKVTVNPADIQIHLPDQFRNGKDFVNSFPYTATDYAAVLNSVTLSGENGVVPETKDYTVAFYTKGDKENVAKEARNAGYYYLAFLLTDSDNNYQVTGVYVGDGTTVSVTKVDNPDGDGYYANNETLKNITVRFLVETAKIEVYLSSQFKSGSAFNNSFGYDRSDWRTRLNPVTFKNELRNGVIPGTVGVDYQVSFYKDSALTDSVVNAGSYTLKFTLAGADQNNFVICSVRAGKDGEEGTDYVVLTDGQYTPTGTIAVDMRAFDVDFTIAAANIEIHLSDLFVGTQDEAKVFINEFVYTRANRYPSLSVVSITNADRIVPAASDYEVTFKTNLEGDATTNAITNVGKYYLIFTLKGDSVTNYNVTGIYAGDGTTVSVPHVEDGDPLGADGKGYFGDMKAFSVKFEITPAQIEVYLSEAFRSEKNFANRFGFNKNDWTNTLNSVQFKNELRNGIFPQSGEYSVSFVRVDKADDGTGVTNVGTYKLVFELTANKDNFVIAAVYAGKPSTTVGVVNPDAVQLSENAENGYEITADEPFTAFSVKFTITPAEIQVHLSDMFRKGDEFVNTFTYNKSNYANILNSVTLSGTGGITPTNGEYSVTFEGVGTTNVGNYKLVFTLIDKENNYIITGVYAGNDEDVSIPTKAGKAYEETKGSLKTSTLKEFKLAFSITAAKLDLYLNGFFDGSAFKNEFVYNNTDQSVTLGIVQFSQSDNIIPIPSAYSVTFLFNIEDHYKDGAEATADEAVYDVGKYTLYFRFTTEAGENYVINAIYAGKMNGASVSMTDGQYRDKTATEFYVDFEITPSVIDVFFSAGALKSDTKTYVNEFFYNRNDWTNSFGSIYLDAEGGGAVPQGSQYSVKYYSGTYDSVKGETWGSTVTKIFDVGRYSVTFLLSNDLTKHYPGVKHYNNFTIQNVYAGGTKADDSVKLNAVTAPSKDGYRKAAEKQNDVYITLVFDIKPNVVKLQEVGDVVFNDAPQDAAYTFTFADTGSGAVLPELNLGDFTATYSVNESEKTGNERFGAAHKPYFAGAYTVDIHLTRNFIFVDEGRADGDTDYSATRNFHVTPVVLSASLVDEDGRPGISLTYDGQAHKYTMSTATTAADIGFVEEGTGRNVFRVQTATYSGWAGEAPDEATVEKLTDGYKNAGAYTITLTFYIFDESGESKGVLGGNFSFGSDNFTMSLTYNIQQFVLTDDNVTGIEKGDKKIYNGKPQTENIVVSANLAGTPTTLKAFDTETNRGDYSISNTSDINVGHVTNVVTGLQNFQGTVDLSYDIIPAVVSATIDSESLPYNAQDQTRSFRFVNESTEGGIVPAYNTNADASDYLITYIYGENGEVSAPHNAGKYTVIVTLHNTSGISEDPNFTFASETDEYVDTARFTFEITKAQITLAVIPGASYTGDPRPAIIAFANAANPTVLPQDYTVTYDGEETVPTHVKTNGSRTPVAYDVKVTLKDVSGEVTGTQRDLSNFKFVTHESATYTFDTDKGVWGQEAYKITPAVITGTLSVLIDSKPAPDISSNVYNALKHNVSVAFRNAEAGFSIIPEGKMGEAKIEGLKATYEVTNGDGLLYNFGVSFTPSWIGYASMPFDGVPENAGAYVISVDLVSADFSFATSVAHAEWTYTVANAQIENATLTAGENSTTFVQEYAFAPDAPISVSLTADDFKFVDNAEGFNAANATFSFTSCSGAGTYEALTNDDGLTIGYKLTGAGTYTIAVTVDAPNHNPWAITLKVTVKATTIKLQVLDAHYDAIYGKTDAYNPDTVLKTVLDFIREGKIRVVDGIAGTPEEQAETLDSYNFRIHILTDSNSYSHASLLKAGDYGLEIDSMPISGFEGDSFIVFDNGTTKFDGNVLTVSPLAIVVETQPGLADMHYNGTSLVNDAANFVNIANIFAGDQVFFDSIRTNSSEGGNYVGSRFEKADAVHVGSYWVHVFTDALVGENGLGGSDSANYLIETKDLDSPTIRYNGTNGVYVFFEIHRRQVELAIANSTSVYGDSDAVYGENGAKKFNISFNDSVLTRDFGMGANEVKLHNFMLDLLALFEGEGSVLTKLNKETKPYPDAGTYTVKLDPDAGKRADGSVASWVLGGGMFNFDDDFVLHIDDGIQSGTHTVTKRDMRVNVHDFSTFYGEPLVESEFEGKAGSWGFTPLDTFVNGDDAENLAITITRNPAAFTGSGLKPTAAGHWPAHYYEGGLTAASKSANYEVKFSEGTGNYNIVARPITVLINRQESVFGEPRVTNLTGETAWEIYSVFSETNMGYATDENRSTVAITLSIDDIINPNAAADIYPNVIKGNCANPNYNVTFRNWVNEGSGNVPGEYEGGEYEITRRKVVVVIDKSEAIYGAEGIKEGMRITLTAPVYGATGDKPINAAQWSYDLDASAYKILPEHISYLTFYLGKATPETPDTRYAVVGKHPIVGVWGHGYDSDMIFMKSYDVQFAGSWEEGGSENENYHVAGVFTVNPADITRLDIGDWSTTQPYREVADKDDRSPDAGWYPMAIEPSYLVYAGDFTVASEGELFFNKGASTTDALVYDVKYAGEVVATITYGKPQNRLDGGSDGIENVENLWTVHSVGVWEMEVTVVADNHNEAKFIYTANVASVVASVYLNTLQDAYTFTYGDYAYADPGDANDSVRLARLKDFPLTDELHTYLAKSIIGVDGLDEAYPALSSQQRIDLILDNSWVEVVSPVISNAGKLAAGRYHIRIVAITGCGFTARFVEGTPDDGVVDFSGYDRLIVEEKELGINWIDNKELGVLETRPTLTDVLTYTYSSYDYEFMPLFTNIVEKDKVDAPKPSYLQDDVACSGKPRNVGEYTIVVPSLLSGPDAKNYKLPEKLTMTLVIVPMKVTVTLFDRTMTYGEEMPGISAPVGNSEAEIKPSHAWTSDKIGAKDDASALGVKISYLDKDGKIVTRETGVGVYRIVGSVDGAHPNYDVTFRNADESGEEAKLTSSRAKLTVAIESRNPGSVYGDPKVAVNYRIESGSVASWQTESQLGITFQVGDGNAKNAGTYYILGDWTEKNYNIVFVGDWTEALPADYVQEAENGEPIPTSPQGAGTYVITRRVIRLKLPETMTSVYGDYSIDGDMTSIKFKNYVLEHVECDTGSSYAPGENVNSLKLSWTLPTVNDVGDYTIHAEEADDPGDPNYEITFLNDLVWTVTERPVIITVHTQRSQYGDNLVTLVGSNKALWSAENLADWHRENAYDALLMVLDYDDTVITNRSNAGEYRGAIIATPTENLNNYTFTFKNDDGEVKGGTYVIEQREIRLDIQDCESVFGEFYEESDFNQRIQNSYKLASGSSLAPWDESDETFKLGVVLTKTGDYHAGIYPITGRDTDSNYAISFTPLKGFYTITRATNEWNKHFTLKSMNEGETPDEDLITATAKFGDVTITYYYDENLLFPVESTGTVNSTDLSTYPKSTYYAKVTVEGCADYTGLEEKVSFVVNESFLVINGGLDITLYVCIFASQFIILTCALIFLRPRKKKEEDAEAAK